MKENNTHKNVSELVIAERMILVDSCCCCWLLHCLNTSTQELENRSSASDVGNRYDRTRKRSRFHNNEDQMKWCWSNSNCQYTSPRWKRCDRTACEQRTETIPLISQSTHSFRHHSWKMIIAWANISWIEQNEQQHFAVFIVVNNKQVSIDGRGHSSTGSFKSLDHSLVFSQATLSAYVKKNYRKSAPQHYKVTINEFVLLP